MLVAIAFSAKAQVDMPEDNKAPVKLNDVIAAYRQLERPNVEEEPDKDGKIVHEGRDYLFDRWKWYWQQHTDVNGYLVSDIKTWDEWNNYIKHIGASKSTAGNKSNWIALGPTSSSSGYRGQGRINIVAFHPTNSNTYWVGTAGGGVWKTTNNGSTWTSVTQDLPVLSTSDIDFNPKNPNTVYVCTGDRDARDHFSLGVLKTTNGGLSWDTTGIKWDASSLRLTNSLVINKIDTNSLTLAASDGIYKSYNGGATWTNVQAGNFKQVLYHPTDTNIIYATSFWTAANQTDAQIFRSKNGGATWTQVTNFDSSWRITLAVSPADVKIVKAIVACNDSSKWRGLQGIWNSTDTGKNFTRIFTDNNCTTNILNSDVNGSGCAGQGNYDLALAIDPQNVNKVYVGGVNDWYSPDGGVNWSIITQWYSILSNVAEVHADKHFLAFHPLVPGRLFECNDGGLYFTDNPQSMNWNDVSAGLNMTQYYRVAVDNAAEYVLCGAQDNGTHGYGGGQWQELTGGDGMDCQIDYADSNTFYTGVQYGKIYSSSSPWGAISDNIPGQPGGGWITPYIISPFDNYSLIAGYKNIYMTNDQGNSWYQVTTDSLDYTNYILRVAMTPASNATIYATIENTNKIYYTHSYNPTSVMNGNTINFSLLTPPYTGNISDIKVDHKDKNHFWVTFSGFGGPQVVEYKSGTWTQMNSNLPNVPVLCLERDTSNGILYIGTDVGVFYMDTLTKPNWQPFNKNMPVMHVTDLGIRYTTGQIYAATYGRGLWRSGKQVYEGIRDVVKETIAISISPNPAKGHFRISMDKNYAGKKITVLIVDNTGKMVQEEKKTMDSRSNTEMNVENLPKGNYIVEIKANDNAAGKTKLVIN